MRLGAARSWLQGRSLARVVDEDRTTSEGRIQVRNILKLEIPTVTNLKVDNLSAEWWGTEWGDERMSVWVRVGTHNRVIMCTQSRTKSKSIVHLRSVSVV
jgi:hypothetical protein